MIEFTVCTEANNWKMAFRCLECKSVFELLNIYHSFNALTVGWDDVICVLLVVAILT